MSPQPANPRTSRGGPRSASIGIRLLTLVLVPLVGLSVTAGSALRTRRATADAASMVHHGVTRVDRLVALQAALYRERAYRFTIVAVIQAGLVTVEGASKMAGYDLQAAQDQAVAEVDHALAGLEEDAGVLGAPDLAAVRRRADTPGATDEDVVVPFTQIGRVVDDAKQHLLDEMQPHIRTAGAVRVADGLTAVSALMELVPVNIERHNATYHLFTNLGDPQQAMLTAAVTHANAARTLGLLRRLSDPVIVGLARTLELAQAEKEWALLDAYAAGNYPRVADGPAEWQRYANDNEVFHRNSDLLFETIDRTSTAVSDAAATLEADAHRELAVGGSAFAGLGIASLAACALLAASITRPLRRLRDHAAELSAGNIAIDHLPDRGPTDVRITARAINDLVDNLRLLESKNQALGDLDFEAEVLGRPLPGALGRSLDRSAQALAGSISERDELRDRVLHEASHDEVTTLPNRSAAMSQLQLALGRAARLDRGVAVVLLDIDGFRRLNDVYGADTCDRLLRTVGQRLALAAETSSMVARAGSDEFFVLVEDLTGPEPAVELARRLRAAIHEPIFDSPAITGLVLDVAVGIAFSGQDTHEPGSLLAAADLALDGARRAGAGTVEIYDRALQERLRAQACTEEALATALASDGELFLQYQPVIDLDTGRMSSAEALIRWNRPGLGIQPPDSFIPVAERSHLIIELDRWVLDRAARQLQAWSGHPQLNNVDVAVNISGRHLGRDLAAHVREAIDATGIDPHRLIIELTETALVDDLEAAAVELRAVRDLGVRVALDDFGTGYTSIGHLRRLPVDIVKIDRSLVQQLETDGDRVLLHLINEMGHAFGNTITAEGVETAEQYDLLRALHCDRAQGFLMSRPLTPVDFEAWAAERDPAVADATVS
jgi:diguanylate cyclase (GGDEF)-like protein